jgi:hypothetical protein
MRKGIRKFATGQISRLEGGRATLLETELAHAAGGTRGSIIDIGLDTPPPPPAPVPN